MLIEQDLKVAKIREKVHLLLQIHDELIYEVEESVVEQATEIITSAMSAAMDRSPVHAIDAPKVPLAVSTAIGNRLDLLK